MDGITNKLAWLIVGTVTLLLITLKIYGVIGWSWWLVLLPGALGAAFWLIVIALFVFAVLRMAGNLDRID